MKHAIPPSVDLMPRGECDLTAQRLIAFGLNSVPFKWWRAHKNEPPLSEKSQPVVAVMDALRLAGFELVRIPPTLPGRRD